MPNPEDWYRHPNRKEFFFEVDETTRIRIRYKTARIGTKSNKKDIIKFSVGLEILTEGEWKTIIRHCNSHNDPQSGVFHIHNKYKINTPWGNNKRIIQKKSKKKIPASQFRWAVKNIKNKLEFYIDSYITKVEAQK